MSMFKRHLLLYLLEIQQTARNFIRSKKWVGHMQPATKQSKNKCNAHFVGKHEEAIKNHWICAYKTVAIFLAHISGHTQKWNASLKLKSIWWTTWCSKSFWSDILTHQQNPHLPFQMAQPISIWSPHFTLFCSHQLVRYSSLYTILIKAPNVFPNLFPNHTKSGYSLIVLSISKFHVMRKEKLQCLMVYTMGMVFTKCINHWSKQICAKKRRFMVPKIVAIKMLDPLVHYQTIRISTLEFGITSSNIIRHNSLLYNGF